MPDSQRERHVEVVQAYDELESICGRHTINDDCYRRIPNGLPTTIDLTVSRLTARLHPSVV